MISKIFSILSLSYLLLFSSTAFSQVEVRENQLVVDGTKQPQLFGAELQYFRLRGGYGMNVPRAKVIALWNKALDRLVEAKMNAISFYIPWDFHEYAEGKFDFTGTADTDGDGNPDYPARDLVTFFKLVKAHGITRIMVRPGPYINAEWGFLGFGAVPKWFHDKFPNSHMRTPYGQRSRLYDYANPDLLRYSALWFKALHEQVLNEQMGPGKPIIFLQLDNETNYQWQPLYAHDYSASTISRYQKFLSNEYGDIGKLNESHDRQWDRWNQVQPPSYQGRNIPEDQAWYRFADTTIYNFLSNIRNIWSQVGVREPQVLFTLAESYNAPVNGLLPNFVLRNARGVTGLQTVNLYPKTEEKADHPLLNFPFKADLDVKAADEANDTYFGSRQEWVMGPEIQGGWWKGIDVTKESRQQTYLSVIGHGLKAFFIYYFNEGQNWDVEWTHEQVKPLYDGLIRERRLDNIEVTKLPEDFWNELQARSDRKILVGFDVRRIMKLGAHNDDELFFDSPLDGLANPRNHFFNLKEIGEQVIAPHQDFLARSLEVHDDVALIMDSTSHQPGPDANIPSVQATADWTGGLLGYMMNADINPRIIHGDLSNESSFLEAKVLVHLDTGLNAPRTLKMIENSLFAGKTVINFLASEVPKSQGIDLPSIVLFERGQSTNPAELTFYLNAKGQLQSAGKPNTKAYKIQSSNPVYSYDLNSSQGKDCVGILYWQDKIVGYRCKRTNGSIVQIGALIFEDYNSSDYAKMTQPLERKLFMKGLIDEAGVLTKLQLSKNAERVVAFARHDPEQKVLWITVKTGTQKSQAIDLKVSAELLLSSLKKSIRYSVKDLLSKKTLILTGADLTQKGFGINLGPNGSAVYVVSQVN
ncbi:MAG: beta-galactosidase [Bacteriovorax sp.]|nr:beta-galactosidase [Bacteriovorax sp.]